jgi:hypothetical protein
MRNRRIDGVGRWWLMERQADVVELAEVADLGFTRQAASCRYSLDRLGTAQGETRRDETKRDKTERNRLTTLCIHIVN